MLLRSRDKLPGQMEQPINGQDRDNRTERSRRLQVELGRSRRNEHLQVSGRESNEKEGRRIRVFRSRTAR